MFSVHLPKNCKFRLFCLNLHVSLCSGPLKIVINYINMITWSFTQLRDAYLHKKYKSPIEKCSLRLCEFKVQFVFPKKMFTSFSESLLLVIFCFCVTGYGYLLCVPNFFYYKVEVTASSEPNWMNTFARIGPFSWQTPFFSRKLPKK